MISLQLRFYEELNDFIPPERRKVCFVHSVAQKTSIKDLIESLGVPHTEIEVILVNGKSVDFNYLVQDQDYISVYPVFETFDVSELIRLRPQALRTSRFILDVHLGKLARYLRLLGFDVVYENNLTDEIIIQRSKKEHRIVLTRDIGILKNKSITHGHWMHNTNPEKQVEEVLMRFQLSNQCKPFTRCLTCNGLLKKVDQSKIIKDVPKLAKKILFNFYAVSSL
ncbi:Mut7-C ubiquitin/RNAse domain-containing protein [Legionella resiliens]|uniref:Mut7-C ubiquitin/RNAse domain-containing protein n=1 Tax=Legionella resiliens TaxID=2905958 RepID=A0ABS8X790_9GAMM|nr:MULTISPECIES: Mut7-C ubiquitin/RNAse domain-containing protein [unclassified Legionella]MCE0723796.1 Mut7-C ubiquitin/RNAse domain-containing protein [Legionella sp. 9fVS26]MCE3532948.1 Mut7-C ubiquitin/RNAse domain-containing protein [Legionella sp. 8cVS16]